MLPASACIAPELVRAAVTALTLADCEAMTPWLTTFGACRLTLLSACITGLAPIAPVGSAFVIEPPAVRESEPALLMVPALKMFCRALIERLTPEIAPLMPDRPEAG